MSSEHDRLAHIEESIRASLRGLGLDLYGVKFFRAGRHAVLRIFVDKEGGATVGECEEAANALSVLLDVENFSEHPYTLEVSTPGLDAELTNCRDFLRHRGRLVTVNFAEPVNGKSSLAGIVDACTDEVLTLRDSDQIITVPISNIRNGKAVVRFT